MEWPPILMRGRQFRALRLVVSDLEKCFAARSARAMYAARKAVKSREYQLDGREFAAAVLIR